MKTELVQTLTDTFEGHAQKTEQGVEYWLARDLQHLLGYTEWRNFGTVLSKAKTACELSGHAVSDHFVDVNKTIPMPKGAAKEVEDLMLTRYACYLIAQNGDPKKQAIAFAQTYFAVQTRQHQLGTESAISHEHVTNNKAVRDTLLQRGIRPESLPASEDVKKLERRLAAQDKQILKKPDALDS